MNEVKENPLYVSWHDSAWIPVLSPNNILEYFSERSNPFYDRTCNNEIVKMQRLNPEQLNNMQGIEYILLHVQEPILYVIRKQHRYSPTQVTPICDYYIIAGVVYQAPDLNSLINSRILSTVHHLQSAFDEAHGYSRYHPSKGYWWEFSKDSDNKDAFNKDKSEKAVKEKTKEETTSTKFQRKRVDILLSELAKKFPPKLQPLQPALQQHNMPSDKPNSVNVEDIKTEIKSEKIDATNTTSTNINANNRTAGPPDKKQRLV